jgi:hypothetical protein
MGQMVLKQYIFVRVGTSLLYLSVVNVAFYCENVLPYTVLYMVIKGSTKYQLLRDK